MTTDRFLAACDVVQADHPAVRARATRLRARHPGDTAFARAAVLAALGAATNVLALRTTGLPADLARP
ncbi:hypothetical protein ABZS66_36605 [Dactylosporangium sp. NPDC005572]|uniref:hypothetical protein n=1 Tax=Dactylosporangium sp. NPDC005572 TaxID=3156889 RepID=UPI0033A4FCAC